MKTYKVSATSEHFHVDILLINAPSVGRARERAREILLQKVGFEFCIRDISIVEDCPLDGEDYKWPSDIKDLVASMVKIANKNFLPVNEKTHQRRESRVAQAYRHGLENGRIKAAREFLDLLKIKAFPEEGEL